LIVSDGSGDGAARGILLGSTDRVGSIGIARQGGDSPQALINRTDIKIDLDFVVLEGDQRQSKTGVGAKPKLEGDIKGGFREGVSGSANLTGSQGIARTINFRERGISDEGELGGVSNHLEISTLLLRSHGELIPDVHPVTILTINSLTTNLNLNLSNKLLTGEIQPTSINAGSSSNGE
jgi:hypothetical protein